MATHRLALEELPAVAVALGTEVEGLHELADGVALALVLELGELLGHLLHVRLLVVQVAVVAVVKVEVPLFGNVEDRISRNESTIGFQPSHRDPALFKDRKEDRS